MKKIFGGPQLRSRSDQGGFSKNVAIVAFGVGIGYYTFQPALKEAAEIVTAKENEAATPTPPSPAPTTPQ